MADGGLLRPNLEEFESRIADSAIEAGGYVVKLLSTGHVDLAGADENSYAVTVKSTKEWVGDGLGGGSWTAQASKPCQLQRVGEALVQLLATNVAIATADVLQTTAGGTVDKITYAGATPTLAELQSVVGVAMEAKDANSGGVIKCILNILRI
jgi:hypothetical protein